MLRKNFFSRILKTFSLLAIFGTFLEFVAPSSWAMEQDKEDVGVQPLGFRGNHRINEAEKFSHIEQLPSEVGQYILSFLPLESYEYVRRVCKIFHRWAQDEQGPFKDLIAFKNTYKIQNTALLDQSPHIDLFSQTLNNMRNALQILRYRSLEEQRAFAVQLFNGLQGNKIIKSSNLTYKPKDEAGNLEAIWASLSWLKDRVQLPTSTTQEKANKELRDLRTVWIPLASVRAFDKILPSHILEWLEETVLPRLKRQWSSCTNALILLDNAFILREGFTSYARRLRTNHCITYDTDPARNPYAKELGERGIKLIDTVLIPNLSGPAYIKAGREYWDRGDCQLAARYYIAAIEKNSTKLCLLEDTAGLCLQLGDYQLAAKYFTAAFEKKHFPLASTYVKAGHAFFNLRDYQMAAKYFTLAIEKDPDKISGRTYVYAADTHFILERYQTAAKYYAIVTEKGIQLHPKAYLNAGYSAAKTNQLERAKIYFENFINHQSIYKLKIKLLPDMLNIIEDVLTTTKSDVPFREWINLKRNKDLQEIHFQK